jgi:hypothetical protein
MVAIFDSRAVTSDAGALLLGLANRAVGKIERFAGCFCDQRRLDLIDHDVRTQLGQRASGSRSGSRI